MPTRLREREDDHEQRMTANLVAAIVCLLILGAGLFIMEGLHRAGKMQDCFEAGRRACVTSGVRP